MKRTHWGHHDDGDDGDGDADGAGTTQWGTGDGSYVVNQQTPVKRRAQQTSQLVFDAGRFGLHRSPERPQGAIQPSPTTPTPALNPVQCADCLTSRDPDSMEICVHCQRLICAYCSVRREATVCLNCL